MIYSASAPGSVMLFGEHAVLYGRSAICAAVNQRVFVSLTPRDDREIQLVSDRLGHCRINLDNLVVQAPFEFVLTAIAGFQDKIPSGFDVDIKADFPATMGLGSSSAVTVAMIGVLAQWLNLSLSPLELFEAAKAVVVKVQGCGSGADVAAAVFGGLVAYRMQPTAIKPLMSPADVVLVYSGAKVPTKTVINHVFEKRLQNLEFFENLFDEMDRCTQEAILALENQQWSRLGELMNRHQSMQSAMGVSTPLLDQLINELSAQPSIYGAKISGSGLGDCVIGLGTAPADLFPLSVEQKEIGVKQIPVEISLVGYSQDGGQLRC